MITFSGGVHKANKMKDDREGCVTALRIAKWVAVVGMCVIATNAIAHICGVELC